RQKSEIPPTAVGGWFRSFLPTDGLSLRNPANGSWWIVQILSTSRKQACMKSDERQLVGGSDPFYEERRPQSPQSHQRQLVVRSDPFYKLPSAGPPTLARQRS